jgi:hypothetical protein
LNKKFPMDEEELNRDLSQPLAGKDPSTGSFPAASPTLSLSAAQSQ